MLVGQYVLSKGRLLRRVCVVKTVPVGRLVYAC